MGNMQEEAGFEPRRVEYPRNGDSWSEADFPDFLSDTVPPCIGDRCRPGYGLIQWTAEGRKQALRDFASSPKRPEGDIGLQVDFMWQELNGDYKGSTLDPLLASTTLEEATEIITRNYEIPSNMEEQIALRIEHARSWLARFGGGV